VLPMAAAQCFSGSVAICCVLPFIRMTSYMQITSQPLRGLLPVLLLGEHRHDG